VNAEYDHFKALPMRAVVFILAIPTSWKSRDFRHGHTTGNWTAYYQWVKNYGQYQGCSCHFEGSFVKLFIFNRISLANDRVVIFWDRSQRRDMAVSNRSRALWQPLRRQKIRYPVTLLTRDLSFEQFFSSEDHIVTKPILPDLTLDNRR
jgi:hypothetical protein